MLETTKKYPFYKNDDKEIAKKTAMVSMTYAQLIEIANIFYFVNTCLDKIPRIFGGLRFIETVRALHKQVHDSAINVCLSLEAAELDKKEKGGMAL